MEQERATINLCIGLSHDWSVVEEPFRTEQFESIDEGYARFRQIIERHGDWLVRAGCSLDFESNFEARIVLKIGPLHYKENG